MDPLPTFPTPKLAIPLDGLRLRPDDHGGFRIGESRITLDLVIEKFNRGYSAEMIAYGYDTLKLPDVSSVIGFYLRHKIEVDAYLQIRDQQADEIQKFIKARQPDKDELKQRLLARWAERQKGHADAGHG